MNGNKRINSIMARFLVLLATAALSIGVMTGCANEVEPPVAVITLVNTGALTVGGEVSLDGTGSHAKGKTNDPTAALSYAWRLVATPSGSAALLVNAAVPKSSFIPDRPGDYLVGLVVSNGLLSSPEATLALTVTPCGNAVPVISAVTATPASPITEQTIQLTATVSDADNAAGCALGQELSYRWDIISLPVGSAATLNNPTALDPSFIADIPGDYTIRLVVTDSTGRVSAPSLLKITVATCGNAAPVVDTATASPAAPNVGDLTTLTITVSDADNAVGCALEQVLSVTSAFVGRPAGSTATLAPAEGLNPAFNADVPGDYIIRTTVTDDTGRSGYRDTTVTVSTCGNAAPVVDTATASPAAPNVGDLTTLAITVSDADNAVGCALEQVLSVTSAFVGRPAGSMATLAPAEGLNPAFTADVPGDYIIRTTVTDGTGRSGYLDTTVTVAVCGDTAPVVDTATASPAAPNVGDLTTLTITVSDADNAVGCALGQVLSVTSAFVGRPAGSTATLAPAEGLNPAFTADVPGDYIIRTTVNDGTGRIGTKDTTVTASTCGNAMPVAQIEIVSPVAAGPAVDLIVATHVVADDLVALSGESSYDPDGQAPCNLPTSLSYAWAFVMKPAGSNAALNDTTIINPSFTPDEPGDYLIRLRVSDGTYTAEATISLTADPNVLLTTAAGYTTTYVTGGGNIWDRPEGIAVDGTGAIYVVQNGSNRVTRTVGTATMYFAWGGFINNAHDIVYYAADSSLFVTSENNDSIIKINSSGTQTRWSTGGSLDQPRGITLFTNASSQVRLVVAEGNAQQISFFNPTSAAPAASVGTEDFGGLLNEPWGVAARNISSTNTYYAADMNGELYRTTGTTDQTLSNVFDGLRDVVIASSGRLIVADANLGMVAMVENCVTPPCNYEMIAWGEWQPYGLAFEASGDLLVTDRENNALYRIAGPF